MNSSDDNKFERAILAFDRGDYAVARPVLAQYLRWSDDVEAAYRIGLIDFYGLGGSEVKMENGLYLLARAAFSGHVKARMILTDSSVALRRDILLFLDDEDAQAFLEEIYAERLKNQS